MIWYPPQIPGIQFYPPQGDTMEEWRGANEDWRKLMSDMALQETIHELEAEIVQLKVERDALKTELAVMTNLRNHVCDRADKVERDLAEARAEIARLTQNRPFEEWKAVNNDYYIPRGEKK